MNNRFFSPFFFFVFWANFIAAQKHDYMWPLGLRPEVSEFRFYYDFKTSDIVLRNDTICNARFSESWCDAEGNILFY
jgi:hypothetical protein